MFHMDFFLFQRRHRTGSAPGLSRDIRELSRTEINGEWFIEKKKQETCTVNE